MCGIKAPKNINIVLTCISVRVLCVQKFLFQTGQQKLIITRNMLISARNFIRGDKECQHSFIHPSSEKLNISNTTSITER